MIVEEIEALMAELNKRHGAGGMRAIATLMHDLGSDTLIQFGDGTYVPCDFIMQMAWANGGAPLPVGNCEAPNGGGHTMADCPGAECRRTGQCQVA